MDNNFSFAIMEHIATVSTSKRSTLELNYVSFNGAPAKLDLRRWGTDEETGARIPFKGISMSDDEFAALKATIERM